MHSEHVIVVIELQLELDLRVGHITVFNRCKENLKTLCGPHQKVEREKLIDNKLSLPQFKHMHLHTT